MALADWLEVQVLSIAEHGQSKATFRMRPNTQFGEMMDIWCAHHSTPAGTVAFLLVGREVCRQDTPASFFGHGLGLFLLHQVGAPPPQIRAVPRRQSPALPSRKARRTCETIDIDEVEALVSEVNAAGSDSKKFRDAPRLSSRGRVPLAVPRIELRVVAKTDKGDNVHFFDMVPNAALGRLMMSWCRKHGLEPDAAIFRIGQRTLSVTDTLLSLAAESVIPPLDRPAESKPIEVTAAPRLKQPLEKSWKPPLAAT